MVSTTTGGLRSEQADLDSTGLILGSGSPVIVIFDVLYCNFFILIL